MSVHGAAGPEPVDPFATSGEELAELGIDNHALFEADALAGLGTETVARAWDLPRVAALYREYLTAFEPFVGRAAASLAPGRAMVVRTRAMDSWRTFPRVDPDLPAEFLPPGFPRRRAREVFEHLWSALGPPAERHFTGLVERSAFPSPRARRQDLPSEGGASG